MSAAYILNLRIYEFTHGRGEGSARLVALPVNPYRPLLAALDLKLERNNRLAKSEADRLKRDLDEARAIIEAQKREIVRLTKKG